jgi:hypothetical protein
MPPFPPAHRPLFDHCAHLLRTRGAVGCGHASWAWMLNIPAVREPQPTPNPRGHPYKIPIGRRPRNPRAPREHFPLPPPSIERKEEEWRKGERRRREGAGRSAATAAHRQAKEGGAVRRRPPAWPRYEDELRKGAAARNTPPLHPVPAREEHRLDIDTKLASRSSSPMSPCGTAQRRLATATSRHRVASIFHEPKQ